MLAEICCDLKFDVLRLLVTVAVEVGTRSESLVHMPVKSDFTAVLVFCQVTDGKAKGVLVFA
jgi:hypothetical protein